MTSSPRSSTYDEPTERKPAYADYVLRVNGILQPGG